VIRWRGTGVGDLGVRRRSWDSHPFKGGTVYIRKYTAHVQGTLASTNSIKQRDKASRYQQCLTLPCPRHATEIIIITTLFHVSYSWDRSLSIPFGLLASSPTKRRFHSFDETASGSRATSFLRRSSGPMR